jgi:hypothetical protein
VIDFMGNDASPHLDLISGPDDRSGPEQSGEPLISRSESPRWRPSIPIRQLQMDALELF